MKRIISAIAGIAVFTACLAPVSAGDIITSVTSETTVMSGTTGIMTEANLDQNKAKISKEEAKRIAAKILKDCFDIVIVDKAYDVNVEYRQNMAMYPWGTNSASQNYVWNINYQIRSSNMGFSQATVVVDATTGVVTSMNRYENTYNPSQQATVAVYKQDQASKIAEDFLNKINPDKLKETKKVENSLQDYGYGSPKMPIYSFTYERVVNGIPFDSDGITVSVDGVSGKVTTYELRWGENKTFPSQEGLITKDVAFEKLKSQLDLKLNYIPYRSNNNYEIVPKTAKLVYSDAPQSNLILDGKTGNFISVNELTGTDPIKKDLSDKEKEDFYAKYKAQKKLDGELDSTKAEEIMKAKLKEILREDFDVKYISYQDNGAVMGSPNNKVWSGQFTKKGDDIEITPSRGSISIDALTGNVISLFNSDFKSRQEDSKFTAKITWEEAYSKALDLVAATFPEKVKEIKTEQEHVKNQPRIKDNIPSKNSGVERRYSFNFTRMVNGIPCQENAIYVGFDALTGLPNQLSSNWYEGMTFPDTKNVLNVEDAKKIFIDSRKPELAYMSINNKESSGDIKLVYRGNATNPYKAGMYFDAVTGKWLNFSGQNVEKVDDKGKFANIIKGHWAEKELEILGFQGIIDTNNFKPDTEITKIDAIKMLVNAKGTMYYAGNAGDTLKFSNISKDSEDYKYLQMAVSYGIIENNAEEFQRDSKVKRVDMAEMIVKLVKYDKIANAKGIFALPFSDEKEISSDKYGYVAIGKGLGIFKGDNGKFRPNDNVLMAEMAAAIYSGIETIQSTSK